MNIKITTDSTCDLPESMLREKNISVSPLTVIKADVPYLDGVTITPKDIFDHVAAGGALCSTSAVSVGEYEDFFASFAGEYDGIIHISLGSGFSASYQNACLAAQEFANVQVVDSRSLTVGQGFVALKAWELADSAESLETLAYDLRAFAETVECSFVVDRLEYLVKGGRCSSAAALGANLLNLKPCIEVKDNKMTVVKKYRGNFAKCLTAYIKERLENRQDVDCSEVFIIHTPVPEEADAAAREAVQTYGSFRNIYRNEAGCTISCHCGPGTLGIIFKRA